MAQATAQMVEGRPRYRWQLGTGPKPTAEQLDRALGALSVACQISFKEAQALQTDLIARTYLAMRGWSAKQSTSNPSSEQKKRRKEVS